MMHRLSRFAWLLLWLLPLTACNAPTTLPSTAVADINTTPDNLDTFFTPQPTVPFFTPTPNLTPADAATPTATVDTPIPTAAVPTLTPSPSPSPTITPTLTPTPRPTINPNQLPTPPPLVDAVESHLWFERPVVGNNSPASNYRFGMTFDYRLAPHHGVDMANPEGTPVVAVGPGVVFFAGPDLEAPPFGPTTNFYGNVVVIKHDQLWENRLVYSLYGHLQQTNVVTGQRVNTGDLVGLIGSTGVALAPHLHFEIRLDDPQSYFAVRNPELWYKPIEARAGVLAARVLDSRGRYLPGHPVFITCQDGVRREVQTYWYEGNQPDDDLGENMAVNDLPAGECFIETTIFDEIIETTVRVTSNNVVLVELRPNTAPASR